MHHSTRSPQLWFVLAIMLGLAEVTAAAVVWNGPTITFTKNNYADFNAEANQDRITDQVWITRKTTQGIFNIKTELGFGSGSPADTEWASGSASNWQSLNFQPWLSWAGHNPPSTVGVDAVVHLISEDIYLDIKFLSFTSGRGEGGGGFSYERSTANIPEPASLMALAMAGLYLVRRRAVKPFVVLD